MQTLPLLLLVIALLGCNYGVIGPQNPFVVQNGKKVPCSNISGDPNGCGTNFYEEINGKIYHCDAFNCDENDPVNPFVTTAVSNACTSHYVYDNLVNEGQSWEVVSPQQSTNDTALPAQVTFTSTNSKTVTVTDKLNIIARLGVDADTLIADITLSVKAEIDHEVTQTVNATIGNAYTVSIPPRETVYGNYGVVVQITSGHLYDKDRCEGSKSDLGTDITYVPIRTGWCVWTSDQSSSLCPSI